MNLFISDNFIDTVGQRVNVLQLVRHVAEDDDLVHVEAMDALCRVTAYDEINQLSIDIANDHFTDIALRDDELYVGGETLKDLIEELYPDDYTAVINALVTSMINATTPSLRLDHNGLPIVPVEVTEAPVTLGAPSFQNINDPIAEGSVATAVCDDTLTTRPVAPFQGDSEEPAVSGSEVAVLNSVHIMGNLKFNNRNICTLQPAGKNGVLFNVAELYASVYGLFHSPDYLMQILVEKRSILGSADFLIVGDQLYLNSYALSALHDRLCCMIEWTPLAAQIVNQYSGNPHHDWAFDLLGNLVG